MLRWESAGVTETTPDTAAIDLARRVTDEAVGVLGESFGGGRMAAISKTVARAEQRRGKDCAWDRCLAKLSERLLATGGVPREFNVKTCPHSKYEQDYTLTPQIDPASCPGCGACEIACPTRPVNAIVVVPLAACGPSGHCTPTGLS